MRLGLNGRFLGARVTGVQRFAGELTKRLVRRETTVLFVPRGGAVDGLETAEVVEGRLRGPLWEQLELPRAARRAGVDVLLHPSNTMPRFGGPHVVVVHDVTPLTRPGDFTPAYRAWFRWASAGAAKGAAAIITVSDHSAGEIARILGVGRDAITVVYQGVAPFDAPATEAEVAAVRARFELPDRYFLGVGRGDPRKGLEFLAGVYAAWLAGRDADRTVPLVVVGSRTGHVHRATREGGPLIALGRVTDPELRALFTGALAFLYPSNEEGFGRVPLEALGSGTRVLVAPYPAASEVLGDAADRIPRDRDRWVAALTRVLSESPRERRRRILQGLEHARTFSWERAAEEVLSVCRTVAASGRSGRGVTNGPHSVGARG